MTGPGTLLELVLSYPGAEVAWQPSKFDKIDAQQRVKRESLGVNDEEERTHLKHLMAIHLVQAYFLRSWVCLRGRNLSNAPLDTTHSQGLCIEIDRRFDGLW